MLHATPGTRDEPLSLAHHALPVLALHLGRVGLQFAWVITVARQLGAAGYGEFSGLVSLGLVLGGLSGLGFGLRLYQDTAREPTLFSRRWHEANRMLLASALPLGGLFLLLARPLFPDLALATVLAVLLTELLLAPFLVQVANAYAAHGKVVVAALVPVTVSGGRLIAALALPLISPESSLVAYAWLHCLATAGVAATCCLACFSMLRPEHSAQSSFGTASLREGFALSGVALVGNALANADKITSLNMGGAAVAGHYTAAQRFVSLVCLPVDALVAAAMPRLFDAGARPARRLQLLGALAALALGYGLAAGLVVGLTAPVIGWLLGTDFQSAVPLVQAFAWLVPAYALRQVGTHALLGFGHVGWRVASEAAALLLLLGLIARWLPELGAVGVVKAVVAAEYALLLAVWVGLLRSMR